jgi:hypothetical protein
VQPVRRGRFNVLRAGCSILFSIAWLGFSVLWLLMAWFMGAPLAFQLFGVPFVLIGVGMLSRAIWMQLVRPVAISRTLGPAEITISRNWLRVGESFTIRFRQAIRREVEIRRVVIQTILRETAESGSGSNHTIVTHDNIVEEYVGAGRHLYARDDLTEECQMRIPRDAVHSFTAPNNKLQWIVRVRVDLPSLPDVEEEVEVMVRAELALERHDGHPV